MTEPVLPRRAGVAPLAPLPADFRAFHQMYRPAYVRWAELYLGNREHAEEAVDHAFEQLAADWAEALRVDSPAGFAWAAFKRHIVEAARVRGRRPVVMDTAAFETESLHNAVDPIGELEESLSLYQAISELPERQHDVIVLRYCIGYSTEETADILGLTVPGVRSTARYARHRLKETLGIEPTEGGERSQREEVGEL
ncbi:sigma-70 family RNA polymerase sigma factor [Streptomyces sp. 3MP-14]|uniref:Sigma-70 family RNA polymerase sigma factor n=1 Tax=Streptomyces mimosae TaxID=2586635 RepID=A0A5N6A7J0_9ACTN|nr:MULTISPECIES: sigma-70 family RNA polymerase sigma factor [Streptomyces]KAB8163418.1 sigma-70 family RNA polymerase sigma factor [Streptomyces mimosae]KAB8174695.1 sigma-70 family RNA polymerase sigma factor [Streptomyces sp. 3MP-14]